MKLIQLAACALALTCTSATYADSLTNKNPFALRIHYGSGHLGKSKPEGVTGGGIALQYGPDNWSLYGFNLYLQLSFDYWHTNATNNNQTLKVYALSPVIRYTFMRNWVVSPFLEASAGPGIMSNNKFGDRKLGTRFTFRDMLGAGVAIGKDKRLAASVRFMHDSNAGLNKDNSGVGVWPDFAISLRF
jgi:lipid A 3-O-deacylase